MKNGLAFAALTLAGIGAIWAVRVALTPGSVQNELAPDSPAPRGEDGTPMRKITARLFVVAEDGRHLAPVEREVTYGASSAEQASYLIEAQLHGEAAPSASAIPEGTMLRKVFVSSQGEAYVDLSAEMQLAHPGGSLNELLSVYAIVNALTVNLPAITGVQILIDGKEVDTLAGHVDLRRPLSENRQWIAQPSTEPTLP